jgi:hypothetical protein
MLIHIKDSKQVLQKIEITFSSEYGDGIGVWNNEQLEVNKSFYVELDIKETLIYDKGIIKTEEQSTKIFIDNYYTCIIGKIEEIETDVITLRIGKSITMLEVDKSESFNIGDTVLIRTTDLNLYETNY